VGILGAAFGRWARAAGGTRSLVIGRRVDLAQDAAELVAAVSPADGERRAQEADEGADRDDDGDVVRAEQWRVVMMHAHVPGFEAF
jgi:hypothetical protein